MAIDGPAAERFGGREPLLRNVADEILNFAKTDMAA